MIRRRFSWLGAFLLAWAALLSPSTAGAAVRLPAGSLDPTFGVAGMSIYTSPGVANNEFASDLALQPDGKIVVAAAVLSADFSQAVLVLRFGPLGRLDPTFGAGGVVTLPLHTADRFPILALGTDGTIVVSQGGVLARLLTSGTLDSRFGRGGVVALPAGSSVVDLLLLPDAKTVVATRTSAGTASVTRYLASGAPDRSFGPVDGATVEGAFGLARQADGSLIVAGGRRGSFLAVTRLMPGGGPDTTFGRAGRAVVRFALGPSGGDLQGTGVAVGPAGGIVVVGAADYSGRAFALARLTSRGRLDPTFSHDGRLVDHAMGALGSNWDAGPVVVQPDGKIVVGGATVGEHGEDDGWVLQRYTSHGLHDASFGVDGLVATAISSDATPSALALQPDGKIVAVGQRCAAWEPYDCVDNDAAVARFIG